MGLNEFLNNTEEKKKETTTELVRVEEGQLIVAKQMQQQLIDFETKRKEIELKEKELKKTLEEIMRANNITGYESNDKRIKISLGEDTTSYDIDKDMLWEKYPNIYRECYVKETKRKGSLRITIRSDKNESDS